MNLFSRYHRFGLFCVCAAMFMAALGSRTAHAQDAPAEPVELRFCYWANHLENGFFRWVTDRFQELNPDVRIRREWFVGEYNPKIQLNLITGKAAEIILMDDELFPRYSVRGYLEDLSPYIMRQSDDVECSLARELTRLQTPAEERTPDSESPYIPTALDSFNYNGFQGGLPWDGNVQLMYFNKNMFDEAGVDGVRGSNPRSSSTSLLFSAYQLLSESLVWYPSLAVVQVRVLVLHGGQRFAALGFGAPSDLLMEEHGT